MKKRVQRRNIVGMAANIFRLLADILGSFKKMGLTTMCNGRLIAVNQLETTELCWGQEYEDSLEPRLIIV